MELALDLKQLKAYLESGEDASALGGDEYIADLYDIPRPLTLDISLAGGKATLLAAAYLLYDEEMDGWYMGDRAQDADEITQALQKAIEAHNG